MLRITPLKSADGGLRLKLEGRLIEPWVGLLWETCQRHDQRPDLPLVLDLAALDFADRAGMDLLDRLQREGARCTTWPPLLKEMFQNKPIA